MKSDRMIGPRFPRYISALTLNSTVTFVLGGTALLVIVVLTSTYSYWVWKSDPDRKGAY